MGGIGFQPSFTIAPLELLQTSQSTVTTNQSTAASSVLSQSQSTASASKNVATGTASAGNTTNTGLGVGLGIELPLLAGLIVALLFLKRLRSRTNSQRTDSGKEINGVVTQSKRRASHELVEMENLSSEMPNSRREITQELAA